MPTLETISDSFLQGLRDALGAERRIRRVLPEMSRVASDPGLKNAFEKHLEETDDHVWRLERTFALINEEPEAGECETVRDLLKGAEEAVRSDGGRRAPDAALIAAARKVARHEIASYETLCLLGRILGYDEAVEWLRENLLDEQAADGQMTEIAERVIDQT